jgi:hypothetical protein
MGEYNIYPDYDAFYVKTGKPFDTPRDSTESDSFNTGRDVLEISVTDDGSGTFEFKRSYLSFDISSITEPITGMSLNIYVESLNYDYIAVTYSGTRVFENNTDYSIYINEGSIEWATRIILSTDQYNDIPLDSEILPYPDPSTDPTLVIGLIDVNDFDKTGVGGYSVIVNSSELAGKRPYLKISTSPSVGYPNTVIGVLSSSISNVNGTNISNISKINVI